MNIKNVEGNVSEDFSANINKVIKILGEATDDLTDRQLAELLQNSGIGYSNAIKLAIFLPVSFCRLLLPAIDWKDQYYEFNVSDDKGVERVFSHTRTYLSIMQEVKLFFATKPSPEIILKIARRSSEFKVVNEMLLAGKKLEEIKLTPMSIIW